MNWNAMYQLCNQTVTIYHAIYFPNGEFVCEQRQMNRVYFDCVKRRQVDVSTSRQEQGFLLVIPNQTSMPRWKDGIAFDNMTPEERESFYTLQPGDKVILGQGPTVQTRQEWAALTPERVDNLVTVKCMDVKYFNQQICHVEFEGMRSYAPRISRSR